MTEQVFCAGRGVSMPASNLRLLIEAEDLEFNDHLTVAEGVQDILNDVEAELTGTRTSRAHWRLVNDPSLVLTAYPNGVNEETLSSIAASTWETFRLAHETVQRGESLTTLAMRPSRKDALRRIMGLLGRELERLTVDFEGREPITFDKAPDAQSVVDDQERYEEVATFDGIVDLLNLRNRPFFALRENNSQQIIRVYYEHKHLEDVRMAAGRTAEVTGVTRFRGDGSPVSMREIFSIFVYPDRNVDIAQFAGSMPDLLSDLSLEEYLDQIRGTDGR